MKELYVVEHHYDVDGGFGDPIPRVDAVGVISATPEEASAFLKKWNRPVIWDVPYGELWEHEIVLRKIEISSCEDIVPYKVSEGLEIIYEIYDALETGTIYNTDEPYLQIGNYIIVYKPDQKRGNLAVYTTEWFPLRACLTKKDVFELFHEGFFEDSDSRS